jgi:hypothetical protein
MVFIGLLSWWYGRGWQGQFVALRDWLGRTYDYFSIGTLARTLFAPFRQDSAGSVNGPLAVKLHHFLDKQISRGIGAIVRTIVILIGLMSLLVGTVIGLVSMIVWPLVPLLPIVGLSLMLLGVGR